MRLFAAASFVLCLACAGATQTEPDDRSNGGPDDDTGATDTGATDTDSGRDTGGTDTGSTSPDNDRDGWTVAEGDCDDADRASNPAATESCNGSDDDCDGMTDEGCDTCYDDDLGRVTGTGVATGTTRGNGNDSSTGCGGSTAEDVRLRWTAPGSGTYTFTTQGSDFDTVMAVTTAECSGASELACSDDYDGTTSGVSVWLSTGDSVFIDVDGYSSGSGNFVLNIYLDDTDTGR